MPVSKKRGIETASTMGRPSAKGAQASEKDFCVDISRAKPAATQTSRATPCLMATAYVRAGW